MPKASFIGMVYAKAPPEGMSPHPQDSPCAELYNVEGHKGNNGVYRIPIILSDNLRIVEVFLDRAQKITNPLPKREAVFYPIYGEDELVLDPTTKGTVNPVRNQELHKTVINGMRRFHTYKALDFQ